MANSNLGIRRIHSIEISVFDVEPWLSYWTRGFGFQHIATSSGDAIETSGSRRHLLRCRDLGIVLQEKVHGGSTVARFLAKHPEGISRVNFLVSDAAEAEERLLECHATPTDFVTSNSIARGQWRQVGIATPLGDVEFCFVEHTDEADGLMPGMEQTAAFDPDRDPIGLKGIDHLTANMRTLMPVIAFFEHVMGFKRYWDVQFHTNDIRPGVGSGLKSIVMWDEESGIKMANNEPLRPRFNESQVQVNVDDNGGPGIQHMSLEVVDIAKAAEHLAASGIEFLPTPKAYYESLPNRLQASGIGDLEPPVSDLQRLGLLVDGNKDGHVLQAFCKDQSKTFARRNAGPLYIELIQRCGGRGFGEGNFRALFEAAETGNR